MATGTVMDAASREALERAMREQGIEKDSAGEEEEVCEPPAPGPATIPEDWPGYLWHYTKQSGGAVLYGESDTCPPRATCSPQTSGCKPRVASFRGGIAGQPTASCNAVLDSAGEWLAAALGITTPRYQYIIDDLIREQREVRVTLPSSDAAGSGSCLEAGSRVLLCSVHMTARLTSDVLPPPSPPPPHRFRRRAG